MYSYVYRSRLSTSMYSSVYRSRLGRASTAAALLLAHRPKYEGTRHLSHLLPSSVFLGSRLPSQPIHAHPGPASPEMVAAASVPPEGYSSRFLMINIDEHDYN
jgi:hypothetical protein